MSNRYNGALNNSGLLMRNFKFLLNTNKNIMRLNRKILMLFVFFNLKNIHMCMYVYISF